MTNHMDIQIEGKSRRKRGYQIKDQSKPFYKIFLQSYWCITFILRFIFYLST